jgi:hypothetical protein
MYECYFFFTNMPKYLMFSNCIGYLNSLSNLQSKHVFGGTHRNHSLSTCHSFSRPGNRSIKKDTGNFFPETSTTEYVGESTTYTSVRKVVVGVDENEGSARDGFDEIYEEFGCCDFPLGGDEFV